ncbi:putative mitochondrial paraflagellar rod component [Leptomonas pyrrhocoris]|uniref:Putative mitochondrial paraflagellar rod component n=1 Tax=Leptomonas pyrrhocoris TaxID=157538 RepID=A0A0N0VE90_LEPPY|nr:putative mitochondrial paraflagellar rod component [Leptomonas pyrrhocoris]XP_015656142.1 putative mitochondrial paraflagellar rod component [Leptomonas pyrrhocoris]KPA77702.1 putative mitochondrial paraflagellar rod component [Leptomonas pyrrhocoris]KPA77703.1 putative mitochondrial paraflagellar rod component [Leptomonas pyrrhocoris]|eukprot:XP_015656141.1 putative mitochondrial paraflagellar rod component [Leptomonas pyrrhocoris]
MSRSAIIPPVYPNRDAQDVENHRVTAAVADLAENSLGIADNFATYAEGRLPPLGHNAERLTAAVQELFARYQHERPAGWEETRFLAECAQRVTPAQLEEIYARPTLDVEAVTKALRELEHADLTRGRYLVMRDNLTALNPHCGARTVVHVPEALTALHDIQHVDPAEEIKDELAEMDVQRVHCAAEVKEAQNVYDAARASEDVVAVERAHRHLIAAQYEYVVCYAKRLHFLNETESGGEVVHFADRLEKIRQDAEDGVKEFSEDKEALRDALQADMDKCKEAGTQEAAAHDAARTAFEDQKKAMGDNLNALIERKLQLIEEIEQRAAELRDVMERQRAVTQDVAEAVKAEAERVTAHDEFVQIADQHERRLQKCLDYCADCAPVVQEMEAYVRNMVPKLPCDASEKALNDIIDRETAGFLEAYRAFVFSCGDLTVKKTHRLDTLERQARLAQHNRDSAMDSLDPNYEQYRGELAEVLAQAQAVEGVINALHATQDAGEQVFESVEDIVLSSCARAGDTFVHPLQEFGHESVAARTRFVDHSSKYVEGEEQEVSLKRAQIANAKALVAKEQQALERAVAAAAARGESGAAAITAAPTKESAAAPSTPPAQIEL